MRENVMYKSSILNIKFKFNQNVVLCRYLMDSTWPHHFTKRGGLDPVNKSPFTYIFVYWSTCAKPGKWIFMNIYVRGIDIISFYDFYWMLDMFRRCVFSPMFIMAYFVDRQSLIFCVIFWRSLFLYLFSFWWLLCFLSFD